MTRASLIFSKMTRRVWEDTWLHSAYVKGHLPTATNEGFKSPIHMITGEQVSLTHTLPFGCPLYVAKDKEKMSDTKFDSKAIATAYVGRRGTVNLKIENE